VGIWQRLVGKKDAAPARADPREGLLARFPETKLADFPPESDLAGRFPSIPSEHLAVLAAFMRAGAAETGSRMGEAQFRRALDLVCREYERGALEVKRAGSEWQVWQRHPGPSAA
jgi:hypothetical protein